MSNTVQNGKGSKMRPTNSKAFCSNYDEINWGRPKSQTMKMANECRAKANTMTKRERETMLKRGMELINGNEPIRKSSEIWLQELYPNVKIHDYDGWNNTNSKEFEHSWTELISRDEFEQRLMRSTISGTISTKS